MAFREAGKFLGIDGAGSGAHGWFPLGVWAENMNWAGRSTAKYVLGAKGAKRYIWGGLVPDRAAVTRPGGSGGIFKSCIDNHLYMVQNGRVTGNCWFYHIFR